jgi:hypothetical protein
LSEPRQLRYPEPIGANPTNAQAVTDPDYLCGHGISENQITLLTEPLENHDAAGQQALMIAG